MGRGPTVDDRALAAHISHICGAAPSEISPSSHGPRYRVQHALYYSKKMCGCPLTSSLPPHKTISIRSQHHAPPWPRFARRLTPVGRELGLVSDVRWRRYEMKRSTLDSEQARLHATWVSPESLTVEEAENVLGQPLRKARPPHADAPRSLPPLVPDPRARARVLARVALQVELGPSLLPRHGRVARLHGGAARPRGARRPSTAEGCKQRLAPLRAAPARGTAAWGVGYADEPRPLWPFLLPQAHHADKAIRLQFRPGR